MRDRRGSATCECLRSFSILPLRVQKGQSMITERAGAYSLLASLHDSVKQVTLLLVHLANIVEKARDTNLWDVE